MSRFPVYIVLLAAGLVVSAHPDKKRKRFSHTCKHGEVLEKKPKPKQMLEKLPELDRRGKALERESIRVTWDYPTRCPLNIEDTSEPEGYKVLPCSCSEADGQTAGDDVDVASNCTENDILTPAKKQRVEVLMQEVSAFLALALAVDRSTGLSFADTDYCGAWIPSEMRTAAGVTGTDFIILVTFAPTQSGTLAWAWACAVGQKGRPTMAQVNIGLANIDETVQPGSADYIGQWATVLHEILHGLGVSNTFWSGYPGWFKDYCTSQGLEDGCRPLVDVMERGLNVTKLVTPEVVRVARNFSGCETLLGVEVENQGGGGSKGSHWERRVLGNELMTSSLQEIESEFSIFTLAYLQDTGHYDVNYSTASLDFQWGQGKNCSFWEDKCSEIQPPEARSPEFCFPSDVNTYDWDCNYHLTAAARCFVDKSDTEIEPAYQYFKDNPQWGGGDAYADYCPTWSGQWWTSRCTEENETTEAMWFDPEGPIKDADLGMARHRTSRCFASNLIRKDLILQTAHSRVLKELREDHHGKTRCFRVSCAEDCLSYNVSVPLPDGTGYEVLQCSGEDEPTYPPGFFDRWRGEPIGVMSQNASVQCWPIDIVCGLGARSQLGQKCTPPTPVPLPPLPPGDVSGATRSVAMAAGGLLLVLSVWV
eukprot:Hpha_TRINITY_DN15391_c6_g4::TRINITY_DN15391_c6_g4_i1::g.90889::m.90889/K01404/GP63; leishmanolysin